MKKYLFISTLILSLLTFKINGQAKYYINSNSGQPWSSNSNINCMNAAFGAGAWTQAYFETVNPNALFSPSVCFVFMEGSEFNANSLNNFLTTNTILMQNWVAAGGKLFLNAGPNQGGNINFGFGGTTLNYPVYTATANVAPGMNAHPIFFGPANPTGYVYTGNSFAHGVVTGGTNVPVMNGTLQPVIAERYYGLGHVFFGGATTPNWHSPAPNGLNFRTNILAFLGGCCGSTTSITAVANPSAICAGQSTTITCSGAPGGTYTSFPGNLTGSIIVVSPTVSTNYNIVGTPSAGCAGGATIRIIVSGVSPTLSISGNTVICSGGTINLAASGANTYSWNTGAITSTIAQSPSTNTFYTVVGSATTGCTATLTQAVLVNPTPTVSISGPNTSCSGSPVNLNASGANTYSWNTGALTSTIAPTPSVNTTYSVIGTSSAACSGTALITVSVGIQPTITVSGNNTFCVGQTTTLTATGANSYLWNNGSFSSSIIVTPSVSVTYTAIGTATSGCSGNGTIAITVNQLPVVSVSGGGSICAGQSLTLTANGAGTYTWTNGPATSTIVVSPTVNTTYSVAGTSTAGCAGNTTTVNVTVIICTGINSQNIVSLNIKLYPNPNKGEFTIESNNNVYTVELMDISGRIILSQASESDLIKINMMNFAAGIYYAKIHTSEGYRVFKVVKE